MLCGTDNISHIHIECGNYLTMFCGILLVPRNIVMNLNNVLSVTNTTCKTNNFVIPSKNILTITFGHYRFTMLQSLSLTYVGFHPNFSDP